MDQKDKQTVHTVKQTKQPGRQTNGLDIQKSTSAKPCDLSSSYMKERFLRLTIHLSYIAFHECFLETHHKVQIPIMHILYFIQILCLQKNKL